jgi:hypothetical protein
MIDGELVYVAALIVEGIGIIGVFALAIGVISSL